MVLQFPMPPRYSMSYLLTPRDSRLNSIHLFSGEAQKASCLMIPRSSLKVHKHLMLFHHIFYTQAVWLRWGDRKSLWAAHDLPGRWPITCDECQPEEKAKYADTPVPCQSHAGHHTQMQPEHIVSTFNTHKPWPLALSGRSICFDNVGLAKRMLN